MPEKTLQERFSELSKLMESKKTRPKMSISTKLQLYGLWNQATYGPNKKPKPSRTNIVALTKWNAYKRYEKLSSEQAKKEFIALAEKALVPSKL